MEAASVFIIVGLSFSFILLVKRMSYSDYKNPADVIPVLAVFIITVELFYSWLYSSEIIFLLPHLVRLNTPLVFVIGPIIFFLIRSIENHALKWSEIHFAHSIPTLLVILYLSSVFFLSSKGKVDYITQLYEELSFDSILLGGLRRIQQGIYFAAAIIFIVKKRESLNIVRGLQSSILIISAFGTLWLLSIYRYFFKFDLLTGMIDSIILSLIAIFLVYMQLSLAGKRRYISRSLDPIKMKEYKKNIVGQLESQKHYLDPKFSISDLSVELDLSVQLVSQVINQGMQTNFNELINTYRVEEAVQLLRSESTKHLTIEAIAESAGFNSTSSFNDNFKRLKGKPPKYYRAMQNIN